MIKKKIFEIILGEKKKCARQVFTKDDKKKSLECFFLSWKPFHKHTNSYSGKINTMTRTMHHNKVYNTHGPMTAAKKAPPPACPRSAEAAPLPPYEVIDRDEFSDSDEMSAETASSSDVASVENGTAVQQNFTPPVSKSALFDNIVEEEGAERERFVNESKRKEVFKTFGSPCKNPRFSNPETKQAKLLALDPRRGPNILKRSIF